MLHLFSVFSDHALFQADAALNLRGKSDASARIEAKIIRDGAEITAGCGTAAADGHFSVSLHTPAASLEPCEIRVTDGNDTMVIADILFGELWIASGQSNMELTNVYQPENPAMIGELQSHPIRIFWQEYGNMERFSLEPEEETKGRWLTMDDAEGLRDVSACGTAFVLAVCRGFEQSGKKVPVGFLNVSWGGTILESWIPVNVLLSDKQVSDVLTEHKFWTGAEHYNEWNDLNYMQIGAMYMRKIAPVYGVKVRGVIWYQGESNCKCWVGKTGQHYARLLRLYYAHYCREFAADENAFLMISSLLFPWIYGESGETRMSYINQAFIDTAVEAPDKFVFCPISDIPPTWAANRNNCPIHPTNKYRVGARMAALALANIYGSGHQKSAATLVSCTQDGSALIVRFRDVGTGLFLRESHARPLYIAGEDGLYLPADCTILSPDTIRVSHPYLEKPVNCAYCFSSFEHGATLWAGEYPVAPFATDRETEVIHIEAKPFLNPERVSVWEIHNASSSENNVFYRPIWIPDEGCEVCRDEAFVCPGEAYSVRAEGKKNPFAVSVRGSDYARLDMQNYAEMELWLFNCGNLTGSLEFVYRAEDGTERIEVRELHKIGEVENFYDKYSADLSGLDDNAEKLRFVFSLEGDIIVRYVNIGKILLKPKHA